MVSGGVNVGKRYLAKALIPARSRSLSQRRRRELHAHRESDRRARTSPATGPRPGYFLGAWCQSHYDAMAKKVERSTSMPSRTPSAAPRAPARGDRLRLLLWRHGRHARRPSSPCPLFQGPARSRAPHAAFRLRPRHRSPRLTQKGSGWLVETPRGTIEAGDVIIATNGYTGACHTATPAPRRAGRLLHHRHRRTAAGDRRRASARKNRSIADTRRVLTYYRMSPRRQAADLRRPRQIRPHRPGRDRAHPLPLHDRPLSRSSRARRSPMPGPAMSPSRSMSCRIWGSSTISIMRWAATARASR